jgi:hypothetical protein
MMGVIAIGAVMVAGAFAAYTGIRTRIIRTAAADQFATVAKNTKILFSGRGGYDGISTEYLIESGAIKNAKNPVGAGDYTVVSADGGAFAIVVPDVSFNDCAYFTAAHLSWASGVTVNGSAENPAGFCEDKNIVEFIVK